MSSSVSCSTSLGVGGFFSIPSSSDGGDDNTDGGVGVGVGIGVDVGVGAGVGCGGGRGGGGDGDGVGVGSAAAGISTLSKPCT